MKVCEYCGTEVGRDTSICPRCGANDFEQVCDNCGTKYDDALYCPRCGVKAGQKPRLCPVCNTQYYTNACPNCGYIKGNNVAFGSDGCSSGRYNSYQQDTPAPKSDMPLALKVILWIFFLPIMATIAVVRDDHIGTVAKAVLIMAIWLVCVSIGSSSDSSSTNQTGTTAAVVATQDLNTLSHAS